MAAVLSRGPFDPAGLFAGTGRSLLRQADAVKGREQRDGWGAAFYRAGTGDPALALEMAIEETRTVWLSVKDRHPGKKSPYRGLNIFLSDGKALWVLCHYAPDSGKKALMTRDWEFGRIAWKRDAGKVVFSSEPLDGGRWNKMSDLEIAEAAPGGTGLTLKFKSIIRRGQGSSE